MIISTEQLLTAPEFFGLETATPVQRAVCRIRDALPLAELADDPAVVRAVGGAEAIAALPDVPPTELDLYSGVRTFKSLFAAVCAFQLARTIDLSGTRDRETPRVSVLSLSVDNARVIFKDHLLGTLETRPALRSLLIGEPTVDSLLLRHPSGRAVEVKVVAGTRAGGSLVSRWSAGVVFDEQPRMLGSEDGAVVNFDDAFASVVSRLLPGAQVIAIGSPWCPWGAAWDNVQNDWGKPTRHKVVLRAPAYDLNPYYWTPQRCADLRATSPRAYASDVLGEFSNAEEAVFSDATIAKMIAPRVGYEVCSAIYGVLDASDGGGDAATYACWCFARQSLEVRSRDLYLFDDVIDERTGKPARRRRIDSAGNPILNPSYDYDPTPVLVVRDIRGFYGRFRQSITFDTMCRQVAEHFAKHKARVAVGDQRSEFAWTSGFQRQPHPVKYLSTAWTSDRKMRAVEWLISNANDGLLWLENHEQTVAELRQFRARIVRGSSVTKYEGKRDDHVALLLSIAMYVIENMHAPSGKRESRRQVGPV